VIKATGRGKPAPTLDCLVGFNFQRPSVCWTLSARFIDQQGLQNISKLYE
jgi:hypothetical protein